MKHVFLKNLFSEGKNRMKKSKSKIQILRTNQQFPSKQMQKECSIQGEEGGTVWLGDANQGISDFTVLPDSPIESLDIRFWWKSHGLLIGNLELSSQSKNYNEKYRIRLSYFDAQLDGIDEDKIRIYKYDSNSNKWKLNGGRVDKIRKRVVGYVDCSSRYALATEV